MQWAALQHQGASKRVMEKLVWTDETKVPRMMGRKKRLEKERNCGWIVKCTG